MKRLAYCALAFCFVLVGSAQKKMTMSLDSLNHLSNDLCIDGMMPETAGLFEFEYDEHTRRFLITKVTYQKNAGTKKVLKQDIDLLSIDTKTISVDARGVNDTGYASMINVTLLPEQYLYRSIEVIRMDDGEVIEQNGIWSRQFTVGYWLGDVKMNALFEMGNAIAAFVEEASLSAPRGRGLWFPLQAPEEGEMIDLDPILSNEVEEVFPEKVYTKVEVMPEFPGGKNALFAYLEKSLNYPKAAKDAGISGTVYVNMVITEAGKVTNTTVIRGIHQECDSEALRVINAMPKWSPGTHHGKALKVSYTLPVKYTL